MYYIDKDIMELDKLNKPNDLTKLNNSIDENNIIQTILNLMEQVEGFIDKNGQEKKQYVMSGVRVIIGNDAYDRYKYFISSFIDFTVSISKGKKLNLNNIKKKYCCF